MHLEFVVVQERTCIRRQDSAAEGVAKLSSFQFPYSDAVCAEMNVRGNDCLISGLLNAARVPITYGKGLVPPLVLLLFRCNTGPPLQGPDVPDARKRTQPHRSTCASVCEQGRMGSI